MHNPSSRENSSMKNQCVAEEKKRKGFHADDPEINALFDGVKRRKKMEKSSEEITILVEKAMADLEIVAEDDAQLNRIGQPAINKLRKFPFLTEVLSKKKFQQEFLDCGVLTLLKNWLEPLPDGSLPNANVRGTILKMLTDFPIDFQQQDRREQLKKSGLGKVIMFLSKSEEETSSNRKLARNLVENWSRIILNKSARFDELRNTGSGSTDNAVVIKKPVRRAAIMGYREADLDLNASKKQKQKQKQKQKVQLKLSSRPSRSSQRATIPELSPMVFTVNPQFKRKAEVVKDYGRFREEELGESRQRILKRLKQMKASKKKKKPLPMQLY